MTYLRKWLAAGLILVVSSGVAHGQSQRAADLVKAQMMADVEGVEAGKSFRVGMVLKMAPKWHVYWTNPGDSGQAATVTFEVPEGFEVSELKYPTPMKFVQPGDLVAYGYGDEVMLMATVTPPKELPAGGEVAIRGKVKYLVCDENACLPGKTDVQLALPFRTGEQKGANEAVFAKWERGIPVGGAEARKIADVKIVGKLGEGAGYVVEVLWKAPAANVEFFPGKSGTISVEDVAVNTERHKSRITFGARVLAGQKPDVAALRSVVGYTDERGERRGIEVAVPVTSSDSAAASAVK